MRGRADTSRDGAVCGRAGPALRFPAVHVQSAWSGGVFGGTIHSLCWDANILSLRFLHAYTEEGFFQKILYVSLKCDFYKVA